MDKFSYISNAHSEYIENLYETYKSNPSEIDPQWQKFFEGFDFAQSYSDGADATAIPTSVSGSSLGTTTTQKEFAVAALIEAYRNRGHFLADTNPVRKRKDRKPLLDLSDFGLTEADLETRFSANALANMPDATLRQVIERLKIYYQGKIGFEVGYIRDTEQRKWLTNKIENEWFNFRPSIELKRRIFTKLNEAVVFENFLHTKYVGQKRFSLEGGESTIPALDAMINTGAELGVEEILVGMAHRGRLNVLANTLGKTYEMIFNEFEGNAAPDLTMGDGDVKYHLGFNSNHTATNGKMVHLKLCPNPSHLEAVNPTVIGFVRGKMAMEYNDDPTRILPILIHGDAAHAGQGIVYEVTQMAKLEGYFVGGTIHLVINNQVGFTTDFTDARSSSYCTDVAKIIEAPVFHVNGDDPEAVVFAAQMAIEFRQKFGLDAFIDLVCYRRHGHNEGDEPKFTQPNLYSIIAKHPNPREIYKKQLVERGDVDASLADQMDQEFRDSLQERLNLVRQKQVPYVQRAMDEQWTRLRKSTPEDFDQSPETGVSIDVLHEIGKVLVNIPEGFKPLKQIEKLLKDREEMIFQTGEINWAVAELMAYGSILIEEKVVRISGQDVQRGTFSHRHAVLHDSVTNRPYVSLNNLGDSNVQNFRIFNSLLSEYAVLGFEFGYGMANPDALTIWEAQFGDFANGAQVMIDQFIASSESKWGQMNGIVLLLPHGYEGQGPEHSSARLERFLQLAGEYNMSIVNITQPANFFHALRRQLARPFRKPLIVMSPKSGLRHPKVVSKLEDLTKGSFQEVIGDDYVKGKDVKRVLLCTGKIYFELLERQQTEKRKDVAIVRLEQIFPFPTSQLNKVLAQYKNPELVWVQEEPENMGSWTYILRHMRKNNIEVISRKESASPATGYMKTHVIEQQKIIDLSFA